MSKRFAIIISVFALMVGLVGTVNVLQAPTVSAKKQEVTICHRTNSIKNPYTVNKVDADSVDGDGGNDNGQGDHYLNHTGPIADPDTMTNGDDWGDIIPPVPGVHDGLNWTEEGQAIYNNDCNLVDDEEGEPNVSATLACNVATKTFTLTISNTGDASSEISLNGDEFTLDAGETVDKTIVDNGEGVTIELLVDGVAYGEGDNTFDGTRPFFCKQGNGGGETPTTPTTPSNPTTANGVASLPVTGGIAPLVSLIAILSTVVAAAASYLWQNRAGSQL